MTSLNSLAEKYKDYSHDQLIQLVTLLHEQINRLSQELYSKKSERRKQDPEGMTPLFNEVEKEGKEDDSTEEDETEVQAHKRKKKRGGKRKPLPDYLPRVRVEHDLSDQEKICPIHNTPLVRIGEEVSEKMQLIPAEINVVEDVTFAYKCPCCAKSGLNENIIKSKGPSYLIPKSFATPSLLAHIAVSKYQDALPLYRQEKIFLRHSVEISRSTMAHWLIQSADAARPIYNLMYDDLLEEPVIGSDETPVQVLNEPKREPHQLSYMWVTMTMVTAPIILFHYYTGRSTKIAKKILEGFKGTVVCDGLRSYDAFARIAGAVLAACMAHIRRKFFQAEKAIKKADPKSIPKTAKPLQLIRELYKIERENRDKPPDEILIARQEKSKPIMEELKQWLDEMQDRVLPKSLLGKAINYALDQWPKMLVFLDNPLVPIDNNRTENAIRPFVIGRGNWLFSATPEGAESSAILYSLVESAKANNIDPFSYLCLIFKELPYAKNVDDYRRLMPHTVKNYHNLKPYQIPK